MKECKAYPGPRPLPLNYHKYYFLIYEQEEKILQAKLENPNYWEATISSNRNQMISY